MSDNQAIVRYNFRLRPGAEALKRLEQEWDCARWIWNQCVEAGNESRQAHKEGREHVAPTWCRMSKKLTAWRAEFEWLRAGSSNAQCQAVRKWAIANQKAFAKSGAGFPQFKSAKHTLPSLEYEGASLRVRNGILLLPKGAKIPVVWSRELPCDPSSCVISQDAEGHWNVSFVVRRDPEKFPPSNSAIGIDWGVSKVATTTSPDFDLTCGDQIRANAQTLKDAQRKLARAKPGSRGRAIARLRVARIHLKISRQRKDRAFKWARKVVTAFGKIAVEDFKPKFLAKSTMAKKATDGAVGMTKLILITMAKAAKRECVLVAPAFTTMTCAGCGTRATSRLALKERTFVCESCGLSAGRDENAARVIRARAGFTPTNVDDVSPLHGFGCVVAI